MNSERWERIKALLKACEDLPSEERNAFLRRECGDDDELYEEVLNLLSSESAEADEFLQPPLLIDTNPLSSLEGGRVLDDFRLEEKVGEGAMGVVFRAYQISLDRRVALKFLAPRALHDARSIERFRQEALKAARLSHKGIVAVHSFHEADGFHFIAMELVEGTSLASEMRAISEGREPAFLPSRDADNYVARILELVAEIADAVAHAHSEKIIHRDIKPSNILIHRDGSPRVVDFGIARDERFGTISRPDEIVGTVGYMSPEQARIVTTPSIDGRTDVYSLGIVLYELLGQQLPFSGDTATEVLRQVDTVLPPKLGRLGRDIPAKLETVCHIAIEKHPEDRYSTMEAFRNDLTRVRKQQDIQGVKFRGLRRFRRSVERRAVPIAVSMAVIAIGFASIMLAMSAAPRATLTIESDRAGDDVYIAPIELLTDQAASLEYEGKTPFEGTLAPGAYRVVVRRGNEFSEWRAIMDRAQIYSFSIEIKNHDDVIQGMQRIPGGEFQSGLRTLDTQFLHYGLKAAQVATFFIDVHEVTYADYWAFCRATGREVPSHWEPYDSALDNHPVVGVSWNDAQAFALWSGKRLPTRLEWELAARGRNGDFYPWGSDHERIEDAVVGRDTIKASEDGSSFWLSYRQHVAQVGTTPLDSSPFGVRDMFGNVWEWTSSPWVEENGDLREDYRIKKGCSWTTSFPIYGPYSLGASRQTQVRESDLGFRCVRSIREE